MKLVAITNKTNIPLDEDKEKASTFNQQEILTLPLSYSKCEDRRVIFIEITDKGRKFVGTSPPTT